MARLLVDAAAWMPTDRSAAAILAAGVQQRLVRVEDLRQMVDRIETLRRRGLMTGLLAVIVGGAEALSELDFIRQIIRPLPASRTKPPGRAARRARG